MAGDLKAYGSDAANLNFSFEGIIEYIKNLFFGEIKNISANLPILLTLLVLFGVKNCFDFKNGINKTVSLSFFSVAALIATRICGDLFYVAENMIGEVSKFVYLSVPLMAGLTASGGMPVTGTKSAFIILGSVTFVTYLINYFFLPLARIYFIFSTVSALLENDMLLSVKNTAKSTVKFVLPAGVGIFTAFLTLFTSVAKHTDEFTVKSAKLAVGNLVPFLGGALSDSTEIVLNSVIQIKAQTGIISVLAMAYIFLTPLIKLCCGILAFKLLSAVACFLSDKQMTVYYDDLSAVLSILAGLMATVAVIVIIGVIVMIQ
jgi:stage III sporulation protein AE